MRVLLATAGSHGDVHPFFALARALARRGHEHLLLTNLHFKPQADRAGVHLAGLVEKPQDTAEFMRIPGVMSPWRGSKVVLRDFMLPAVPEMYARARKAIRDFKPDIVVLHPICMGVGWAAATEGVPTAHVALAPLMWVGSDDPRVFGPFRAHEPTRRAVRFDEFIGRWYMRWMLDRPLNAVRMRLHLPPLKDALMRDFVAGDVNLGMWSPAFRGPKPNDPPTGVICGFPFFDDHHDHATDERELNAFLDAGEAPIVFTLGTAAVHAPGRFYHAAAQAAHQLKRRAVLLVGRPDAVRSMGELPAGVRAFTYAPFSTLLPRACATVHHGGIGSTAQGLRSGRPTLIVPLAHDQFDNAARARRLNTSRTLPHAKADARSLAASLDEVLNDPSIARAAADLAPHIAHLDGADTAVTALETCLTRLADQPETPRRSA